MVSWQNLYRFSELYFFPFIVLPWKRQHSKGDWVVEQSNFIACIHRRCKSNKRVPVYLLFLLSFSDFCCFAVHTKTVWIYIYIFFGGESISSLPVYVTISRVPLSLSLSCVTRQKPRGHAAFFLSRHAWRTKPERDYSKSTLCTFCFRNSYMQHPMST